MGGIEADQRRAILDLAAKLLERLRGGDVRELEVRQGGVRVRVSSAPATAPLAAAAEPASSASAAPPVTGERPAPPTGTEAKSVNAPLTGVFYRSASPQVPPFVQVGAVVSVGDVIGLIEAMKLFNEVRTTIAGRVKRIVAENGQLVRAHAPLVELE